ncbi:MAG TPA: hypothetical protein PK289_03010 [Bacteroidia bacterium]|jgi:hypothetical protein|nr:hypothetical protein [Bacteroidia bacterium]HRG53258.1 hypothetical protein [Bacteroidia bacterium]
MRFTINEAGEVSNPVLLSDRSYKVKSPSVKAASKAILLTNKKWVPALKNGLPTTSFFTVSFILTKKINIVDDESNPDRPNDRKDKIIVKRVNVIYSKE